MAKRDPSTVGFTLVELVVCVAIIAILLSLTLVGLQSARESSRRTQCQSNLRQMGIALQNYASAKQYFPRAFPSWLAELAPYMEMEFLDPKEEGLVDYPMVICPSDSTEQIPYGNTFYKLRNKQNYSACVGFHFLASGNFDGAFSFDIATFDGNRVGPKDIVDGTSNTAMVSEIVRSGIEKKRNNVMWNLPHDAFGFGQLVQFQELCQKIPLTNPGDYGWLGGHDKGSFWQNYENGGVMMTLYNHALPPNCPSCLNGTNIARAIAPPSSEHRGGGVNLLSCDGHISHISREIDPDVWRYLGSRNDRSSWKRPLNC